MVETKTLAQVAGDIGVPANTIKTWLHQVEGIPAEKDSAGRWRFPLEAEEVLRQIQALRLDGRTMSTVRRRLNDGSTDVEQFENEGVFDPDRERDERRSTPTPDEIAEAVKVAVVQAIQAQTEQAEKYARATYRVGELEATVKALEGERERLAMELAETRQRIALLEAPKMKAQSARPWWRIW